MMQFLLSNIKIFKPLILVASVNTSNKFLGLVTRANWVPPFRCLFSLNAASIFIFRKKKKKKNF